MTLHEDDSLLAQYTVDEAGLITNPGKFERETLATVYYRDLMVLGTSDETVYDENERVYDYFKIEPQDVSEIEEYRTYPQLRQAMETGGYFRIHEDDDGFVHGMIVTAEQFETHKAEIEANIDADEGETY